MLTTTQSRQLSVLVALRDATGDKTRTPVPESAVVELLRRDAGGEADFGGSVPDELDDLERQGFALITARPSEGREVEMTAHGKMKAEEFARLRARGTTPPPAADPEPASRDTAGRNPRANEPAQSAADRDAPSAEAARSPLPDATARTSHAGARWSTAAREVLDAAAQAISLLPPHTAPVVRSLIEDARGAVSAGSEQRTRRALTALSGYLADPASGALANVLAAQMRTLVDGA